MNARSSPARGPLAGAKQEGAPHPRGRRAELALGAAYFLNFASIGIQIPHAAPALESVGFGAALIGSLWALRATLQIGAPTIWGLVADRLQKPRQVAAAVIALGAVSQLILAAAQGSVDAPDLAPVGLATVAFALYGMTATATAALVDGMTLTALGNAPHRYGQVRMWGAVGFGLAALASTEAVDAELLSQTPAPMFTLAALLLLGGALSVALAGPAAEPQAPSTTTARKLLADLAQAVRDRWLVLLTLGGVLHWASHGAYTVFMVPLAERSSVDERWVGWALVAAIVCEVGVLRMASRWLARFEPRSILLVVTGLTILRWGLLASVPTAVVFVLAQALHGFSFGLFYTAAVTLVGARVPASIRQASQGLFSSLFFGVGGALGFAATGWVLDDAEASAAAVWGVMAGFAALAGLVFLFLPRAVPEGGEA